MGLGVKDKLINKYGEEEGLKRWSDIQKRAAFSRSKEGYIERYGEKEGLSKWEETQEKRKFTKEKCIDKYGEEEGKRVWESVCKSKAITEEKLIEKYGEEDGKQRWNERKENDKRKGTLQGYVERYGEEDGTKKYNEKNEKLSISVDALKKNGKTDEEIKEIKERHSKKSAHTKETFIARHGEEAGIKKWNEWQSAVKERSVRCIEYWMKQGFSSREASEIVSDLQDHSSLERFIERHGKEEGTQRFHEVNEKKTKHFVISPGCISKLEMDFFDDLSKIIEIELSNKTTVRIKTPEGKALFVDYVDLEQKKCIEIYGSYWHMDPRLYEGKTYNRQLRMMGEEKNRIDKERINTLEEMGYDVLVIWEKDIKDNRTKSLQEAKEFLTQNKRTENV